MGQFVYLKDAPISNAKASQCVKATGIGLIIAVAHQPQSLTNDGDDPRQAKWYMVFQDGIMGYASSTWLQLAWLSPW